MDTAPAGGRQARRQERAGEADHQGKGGAERLLARLLFVSEEKTTPSEERIAQNRALTRAKYDDIAGRLESGGGQHMPPTVFCQGTCKWRKCLMPQAGEICQLLLKRAKINTVFSEEELLDSHEAVLVRMST